jgi:hypothetical protein
MNIINKPAHNAATCHPPSMVLDQTRAYAATLYVAHEDVPPHANGVVSRRARTSQISSAEQIRASTQRNLDHYPIQGVAHKDGSFDSLASPTHQAAPSYHPIGTPCPIRALGTRPLYPLRRKLATKGTRQFEVIGSTPNVRLLASSGPVHR